jgi:hypothetical protein
MQTSMHLELAVTSNPKTSGSLDRSIVRITRKARRKLRTEEVKREACRSRDIREGEKQEKKQATASPVGRHLCFVPQLHSFTTK